MYDTELRDQWCGEALRWTCGARSRHAASRSHQAFCALRPVLAAQSASAMLAALHKCLAPGGARHSDTSSLDTAVEVLCSLRALLAGLLAEPAKALLYPQLLLACVALLNSSVVRVVELAMHLLLQVRPSCPHHARPLHTKRPAAAQELAATAAAKRPAAACVRAGGASWRLPVFSPTCAVPALLAPQPPRHAATSSLRRSDQAACAPQSANPLHCPCCRSCWKQST